MKSKLDSIPSLIVNLFESNFFVEGRNLSEVKEELSAKGYNFSRSVLNTALIRLVRTKKILTRVKDGGLWKYIQKKPFLVPNLDRKINCLEIKYSLHPQIALVSWKQFEDGYYKESIQNALVEVVDQVKIKTQYPKNANGREFDGDDLMNRVFGCDNQIPMVKFNSLETSLDKAEQRGIMNLFKGIVGIRDRKAHLNFIQNDPFKTVEYLSLASLLLRLLDENEYIFQN